MGEYRRPPGASTADFNAAREFEETVGTWLGPFKVSNLTSSDRLDWWVPGLFLDVKEKRQSLGPRWHLLPGVPEADLFVVDELSVRRAAAHYPHAYFLIRDCPTGRIFLARIDEMFCAERARLNRNTGGGLKGKWVVNLRNFRQLLDPANQLLPMVLEDQTRMPWKSSACVTELEVPPA